MIKLTKNKRNQSPVSNDSTKQSSPFSSRKKLLNNKRESIVSPKNSSTSPRNKESKSPTKFNENRKSIIHTQRFDRAKTLKVVFRRPSEAINVGTQQNNLRGFSIDIDINDEEQSPLKMIPKAIILYEEAKNMIKKVSFLFFFILFGKKSYKKAFLMVLKYFMDAKEKETNFNLLDDLKLNRVFFVALKKIIKNFCCSKSHLPLTKINILMDILDGTLSNCHSYLVFMINKFQIFRSKKPFLPKSECESQTSFSSVEKEAMIPVVPQITNEPSFPELGKSASGKSIFKLIKTPMDNRYDRGKANFTKNKKRSLRNLVKKKIPEYFNYINVLNVKDFDKFNGINVIFLHCVK